MFPQSGDLRNRTLGPTGASPGGRRRGRDQRSLRVNARVFVSGFHCFALNISIARFLALSDSFRWGSSQLTAEGVVPLPGVLDLLPFFSMMRRKR